MVRGARGGVGASAHGKRPLVRRRPENPRGRGRPRWGRRWAPYAGVLRDPGPEAGYVHRSVRPAPPRGSARTRPPSPPPPAPWVNASAPASYPRVDASALPEEKKDVHRNAKRGQVSARPQPGLSPRAVRPRGSQSTARERSKFPKGTGQRNAAPPRPGAAGTIPRRSVGPGRTR